MRTVCPWWVSWRLGATLVASLSSSGVLAQGQPATGGAVTAEPLPPLQHYLAAAEVGSFAAQAARATQSLRGAEQSQSLWQVLPRLSLRAAYTRNDPEVAIEIPTGPGTFDTAIITRRDQLDGSVQLDVPLVDVGGWLRVAQTGDLTEAAQQRTRATVDAAYKNTARAYFALVGAHAVQQSARRSLTVAEESRAVAVNRLEAGFATDLDVLRATAEVERCRQVVVGAEARIKSAARSLSTLTALQVSGTPAVLSDDLHDEAPVKDETLDTLPAIKAARAEQEAQNKLALATLTTALAPTIAATVTDRLTNAAGFGEPNALAVGVAMSWRLDGANVHAARAQQAASTLASIRAAESLQAARDELHESYDRLTEEIARARAARAQQDASFKAAAIARQRVVAGTATIIDGVLADRDAFAADVARIESDVNVQLARVLLRLAAGEPVTTTATTATTAMMTTTGGAP